MKKSIKIGDKNFATKKIVVDGAPNELKDEKRKQNFREYHKDKANLRIVKKDLNLGRSFQARVKRQKKDLTINDIDTENNNTP